MLKKLYLSGVLVLLLATPTWAERYTDNGNGTVTDTQTKLVWQQTDDGVQRNWESAIAYCESLNLAGTGWRLPNLRALQSIVDDSRIMPSIDPLFLNTQTDMDYWTSTTQVDTTTQARVVWFRFGEITMQARKSDPYYFVRCVRGGL